MKTAYSISQVETFLSDTKKGFITGSVAQLSEGHTSQVFSFQMDQDKYVLRIRKDKQDFIADVFAYKNFSNELPIPEVLELGSFDDTSFYAITRFIAGKTLNELDLVLFEDILPNVKKLLSETFEADISHFTGYGVPDFASGNAPFTSWRQSLENELQTLDVEKLHMHAANIGLREDAIDKLVEQFESNLQYVSEQRRLLHGDPGGDNIIVDNISVIALLDWEQMAYGDWLRDFTRFEFWGKNLYGDTEEFAKQYNLEAEHIKERKAAYWAIHALRAVEFASRDKSDKVATWLRANLDRIFI